MADRAPRLGARLAGELWDVAATLAVVAVYAYMLSPSLRQSVAERARGVTERWFDLRWRWWRSGLEPWREEVLEQDRGPGFGPRP